MQDLEILVISFALPKAIEGLHLDRDLPIVLLLVQTLDRVRAVQLCAVLAREGHVGQHVMLAGVHEIGQLGPARAQLLGHLAPGLAGMGAVWLVEGLADGGGDDGVLAAGDVGRPTSTVKLVSD